MKLIDIHEAKQETAESAFMRYKSLKKSNNHELAEKVLALANSLMDEKFKLKKRDYEEKYAGTDWWEVVKKMYKIEEQGNKWVVVSNAANWKQIKDWEFDTKYEATEQLEKLIGYKHDDRKKGVGSMDKDYERVDDLEKKRNEVG